MRLQLFSGGDSPACIPCPVGGAIRYTRGGGFFLLACVVGALYRIGDALNRGYLSLLPVSRVCLFLVAQVAPPQIGQAAPVLLNLSRVHEVRASCTAPSRALACAALERAAYLE